MRKKLFQCSLFCYVVEALKGMEAVAEHINEMQKIYDEYGSVFDELSKSYKENNPHKPVRFILILYSK